MSAVDYIEQNRKTFEKLSKAIWDYPEIAFQEYKTSNAVADLLNMEGFHVERNIAGLPTAIKASWGKGNPSIGFLGELDALPGFSQQLATEKKSVMIQGNGHACGHNLVAIGHAAAAIGLKRQMEKERLNGRVVYYGCPGEEEGTGKLYMAKAGAFSDLDCFIHFHPGQMNTIGITAASSASARFDFIGKTAHPAFNPQEGRNALHGAELMNVGIQYLKDRLPEPIILAAIITEGGKAANVIPEHASILCDIRSIHQHDIFVTYDRLLEVAEGAAKMSGTRANGRILGCTYSLLNNSVLMDILEECFQRIEKVDYTPEELDFMYKLNQDDPVYTREMKHMLKGEKDEQIHTGMMPMTMNMGATDVGDVSHIVPGVTFRTACYPFGVEGHTWKSTVCSGHSIGTKGMIRAAKIMALFGEKILKEPEYIVKAKAVFEEDRRGIEYKTYIDLDLSECRNK